MRHIALIAFLIATAPLVSCGDSGPEQTRLASTASYAEAVKRYNDENAGKKQFNSSEKAVIQKAATDLVKRMPNPGIKVGENAPDFELPNAFGQARSLSRALQTGPVVLVFYRGAWCPYCNLHLHALQQSLPQMRALGARLIAVTPQTPDRSAAQIKEDGYPFEVLSDLDNKVMKAYRLLFQVDPDLVAVYKTRGLDLAEYNGADRYVLPVPATFVIDTDGIVRAMQANTDYRQRMEPAEILAALRDIARGR